MDETVSDWPKYLSLAVHELSAPLQPLSGWLGWLLREQLGPVAPNQRKGLEEIKRSAERLAGLIKEISDLGQLLDGRQPLTRGTTDLTALLNDVEAQTRQVETPQDDRRAPIRIEAADPLMVTGDRGRLRDVLQAMIRAMRREIVDGSELVIQPRSRTLGEGRRTWIVFGSPVVAAALRDASPERIVPFDVWRGGCGLVLPFVAHIVELHQGRLLALRAEAVAELTGEELVFREGVLTHPKQAGAVVELPLVQ